MCRRKADERQEACGKRRGKNMDRTGRLYAVFARGFAVLAILLTVCTATVWVKAAEDLSEESQNFKVKTEYGIDGFAVYGRPVVVSVTVESQKNFSGILRVVPVSDDMQKTVAYGESVTLTAQEEKTFNFVPSSMGGMNKIRIELLDERDKVVYAKEETISMQSADSNLVVGILSDDFSALNYFDGLSFRISNNEARSCILELRPEQMPTDSSALSVLDCIMIDNFDTAALSDNQYEALKQWVENGGMLFLSLGSHYQNVLHRFSDDFITGTFGDLKKRDIAYADGILDVDCVDFDFDGATELSTFTDDQTVYYKNIGMGNVILTAYSLGMEPITGYTDRTLLATALLQSAIGKSGADSLSLMKANGSMFYVGLQLAQMADSTPKPSTLLYGTILFIYVIVVGPVIYLILRAVKKRERIWIAVPVIALVFTGVIYFSGFLYRVRKPMVNTFTMISLNEDTKREQVYTQITCPSAKRYTVSVDERYSDFEFNNDGYSYNLFSGQAMNKNSVMLKRTGNGMDIVMDNSETFLSTSFFSQGTDDNNLGSLDYDLVCTTTGFEGTVTNNTKYDMQGVVVTFENYLYLAGDVAKGETVSIQPDKIIESYGDVFEDIYTGQNSRDSGRDGYIAYQIDSTMESNFVGENVSRQGCIWGKIGDYEPDLIEKSNVKQSGMGIIYEVYSAEYADVSNTYFMNIMEAESYVQGEYDTDGRMYYGEEVIITYDFRDYPELTTLQLLSQTGDNLPGNTELRCYATVYAMNMDTGAYEALFENGNTESLAKYMRDGELVLKYEQTDPLREGSSYIPKIAARGDE
ncbi:MAG: hypothetical protein K2K56_10390 [Lachnospiraceae bacterium]|nr:hypothetical protein [Lachnospiraceae bacterium]